MRTLLSSHTEVIMLALVPVATSHASLQRCRLVNGFLDRDDPAISLASRIGLESVLMAHEPERKVVGTLLGDISGIGEVQNSSRSVLVILALGEQ